MEKLSYFIKKMTTDLDNDLYKEDLEFQYDQLIQFSHRDKLPFPKQEDFVGILINYCRL